MTTVPAGIHLEQLAEIRRLPLGGDRNTRWRMLLVALAGDVWSTHVIHRDGTAAATTRSRAAADLAADAYAGHVRDLGDDFMVVVSC